MARVSFMQTSMLGGRWSDSAQGRMHDPAYKTAMSECLNGYPTEEGAWLKRPGLRYVQHTRHGAQAVIRSFDFTPSEPYVLEFTDLKLRIFSENAHVLDSTCNVLNISSSTPAIVLVDALPSGWAEGDSLIFTLENDPCGPQAVLCNRQFTMGTFSSNTFQIHDPITGDGIDGSTIGFLLGAVPDRVSKIVELTTPYAANELDAIRVVSDNSTVLILHGSHQPRVLSKDDLGVWTLATQDFTDGPYLDIQDPKVSSTTLTLSGGSYNQNDSVTVTASAITGINKDTGFQTTDIGRLIRFRAAPPVWDKATAYTKGQQVSVLSQDNIYTAQGGITGLDPTLDDGTHWTISAAKVNWIALKITSRSSTTVVQATVQSDLREGGTFAAASGNDNIRAAIGDSGFPMLDAKLNQIDFTALFAVGNGIQITNGAFTDGGGGDISATYTVRGTWNDPDDNRSLLQFTDDGGQTADWATVAGLSDSRTAYFSPDVGQTLAGDELVTPVWQLGVYSDTTGWPECGTYHESRLWLSGQTPNRIDASMSNAQGANDPTVHFSFAPTGPDGTISDANAIAAVFIADEQNDFFWLLSVEYGLIAGSLNGEWLIRSSSQDDPISDASIQGRRVTKYGCANIEPQICLRSLVFVHRHQRRVMDFANYPWGEAAGWYADNLDHLASDLTCGGIAEIRYQQTPSWNLWMRRTDGTLIGSAFRHAAYGKESFNGWHRHDHGNERTFESIAVGVSGISGEGEQLYAVTNQTDSDEPDYNVRWIEVLAPEFDGCDPCDAFIRDGAPTLCCAELIGGTTPTGLTIYGLWHLNGKAIQPYLGGLALGDYTVANGAITIPFGTKNGADGDKFSWAYFQTLESCDLFGATASLSVTTAVVNPNSGGLEAFVSPASSVGYGTGGGDYFSDPDVPYIALIQNTGSGNNGGIMVLNRDNTGDEHGEADNDAVFGAGPVNTFRTAVAARIHPNGNYYGPITASNQVTMCCVRLSDQTLLGLTGTAASGFGSDSTHVASPLTIAPLVQGTNNYLVQSGLTGAGAGGNSEISLWNVNAGPMAFIGLFGTDEAEAAVCEGLRGRGDFYVLGAPAIAGSTSDPFALYEGWANTFSHRKIGTVSVTDVDPTWTTYFSIKGPGFDQADGNLLVFIATNDSVTHKNYLVKVNRLTGAVMWASAISNDRACNLHLCTLDGTLQIFEPSAVRTYDLSDGTQTTTAWDSGLAIASQFFDCTQGCIVAQLTSNYSHGSGPTPTYIGQWLANNSNTIPGTRVAEIFSAADLPDSTTVTDYPFYGAAGFSYTSRGQLLRPDFGQDGGAQAGPAFGKVRVIAQAAMALVNTRSIKFGTSFDHLNPVPLASPGGIEIQAPTLFTGTVPFKDMQINDNGADTDSRLCWEAIDYPATVTAIAGLVDTKG